MVLPPDVSNFSLVCGSKISRLLSMTYSFITRFQLPVVIVLDSSSIPNQFTYRWPADRRKNHAENIMDVVASITSILHDRINAKYQSMLHHTIIRKVLLVNL